MAITIIKKGTKKDKPVKVTCQHCGTTFTYQQEDRQFDQREGSYVICPDSDCKSFINI